MNEKSMNETHAAMIQVVCAWWGKQMGFQHDMNSEAKLGLSGIALALSRIASPPPNEDGAARVIAEMERTLKEKAKTGVSTQFYIDYHPEDVLGDIIDRAGNPRVPLPIKTIMWIDWAAGVVGVKCGYGAPDVRLFPPADKGGAE